MKTHPYLRLFALAALSLASPSATMAQPGYDYSAYASPYPNAYNDINFYDQLAPYGQWLNHPEYGDVWVPDAPSDFQPYASNGHWVVTEYGNTWVSDFPWGWAAFHYGRWFYDNYYGWSWVPGSEWGPAWVDWRSGGGYYGWAPLGPGVDINVVIDIPAWQWVFVPQLYITSPRVYSYCVPRNRVVTIYRNCAPVRNYYRYSNHAYVYGPQRHEMERVTRGRVPVYRIDQLNRPGRSEVRDGSVHLYRPDVSGHRYGSSYAGRERNPSQGNWQEKAGSRSPYQDGNAAAPRESATNWYRSNDRERRENERIQPNNPANSSPRTESAPANRDHENRNNGSPGRWQPTYRRADQTDLPQQSGSQPGQRTTRSFPDRKFEPAGDRSPSGRRIEPFQPQQPTVGTSAQQPANSGRVTPQQGNAPQQRHQETSSGQYSQQRPSHRGPR